MKLVIQTRDDRFDTVFYNYEQLEIESFRWEEGHKFSYVVKDSPIWKYLEDNQEIVGLGI